MFHRKVLLLLVATVAFGALVKASFLHGKGDLGGNLWKGDMSHGLDSWKGEWGKGFDLWKGKGLKGKGWLGDKGVVAPSVQTSCQVVYDDVWEEKCQTVYNDVCQDIPSKECQVVQEKECALKEVEECSFVLENKCVSVPIPNCSIKWEKQCSKRPVCRTEVEKKCKDTIKTICSTINDHQCTVVQKEVCKTNVNKQCKTVLDKVCKMVPVVIPNAQPQVSVGSGGWTEPGFGTGSGSFADPAWQTASSGGLPTENQVNLGAFKGRFEGPASSFKESPAYIKVPNEPDNIISVATPSNRVSLGSFPDGSSLAEDNDKVGTNPTAAKNSRRRRRRRSAETTSTALPKSLYEQVLEERQRTTRGQEDQEYLDAVRRLLQENPDQQNLARSSGREERSISDLLAKKLALKLKKKAAILEAKKNFKLEKAALLMGQSGWANDNIGWSQQPQWVEKPQPQMTSSWAMDVVPTPVVVNQAVVEYVETCQKVPRMVCVEKPEQVCQQVPEEQCHDVPREQCREVPDQLCTDEAKEICEEKEFCKEMPQQQCDVIEKQKCTPFPNRKCQLVPKEQCRTYPREVCTEVTKRQCSVVPDKACKKMTVKRPREVCIPPQASSSSSGGWAADPKGATTLSEPSFIGSSDPAIGTPTGGSSSSIFSNFGSFL